MIIIRPANHEDIEELATIAAGTGIGFTTLPPFREIIEEKVYQSCQSFSNIGENHNNDYYLFVLEDLSLGKIAGTSAIVSSVGSQKPFYNYKVVKKTYVSESLNIYNDVSILELTQEYTGSTELSTLFLLPEYRKAFNGKLLSKSRFLFMARNPDRFSDRVIAELRGFLDFDGKSPFFEGVANHFFPMGYRKADLLSGIGKSDFITELMPVYPIYINLLDEDARNSIGKVHRETVPAKQILEKEGFRHLGYVDIFDGGPTVEAKLAELKSIKNSIEYKASIGKQNSGGAFHMVCNARLSDFRCGVIMIDEDQEDVIEIEKEIAEHLRIVDGDTLRIVKL